MDRLFKSVLSVRDLKFHVDDDFVDRLSRQYTVVLTVLFAFLVSTKQFVGRPIHCWCPAEFEESHVDYTEAVCWVSSTYFLDMDTIIPGERLDHQRTTQRIGYYQWVPFILIAQGVFTYVPCLLWRFLNKRSGICLNSVLDAAHYSSEDFRIHEIAIRYVVKQLDSYLMTQRNTGKGCSARIKHFLAKFCCIIGGRLHGNYLITAYLSIKALYVINAVGQLFLLNLLLISDYHLYGVYAIERFLRGEDWSQLDRFPRVTLCEFEIRHQSRLHYYVVQCALTINLFSEKIFLFIWFWFVFVAIATAISFCVWLFRALYWRGQLQYVSKQLLAYDQNLQSKNVMENFTVAHLRRDGMFVVRMIGINMGEVIAGEVIWGLWNKYNLEKKLNLDRPRRRQVKQNGGSMRRSEI